MRYTKQKTPQILGRISEVRVAKDHNATLTSNSGAGSQKSDSISETHRIESKSTTKSSISLKKEWLDKITKEAVLSGKKPLLSIDFLRPNTVNAARLSSWVLIEERDFLEMQNALKDN